jgi:DNA-binding response OmpR family regulator
MSDRILIIDDDPAVHEVSGACLERDGYIVSSATEGETGLALTAARTPALVILDLGLPDMSGESVLREIRRRSRMPVIVLSAKGDTEERVTGLSLGADDYLAKPYSARELVARVKALLRRASGDPMGLDLLSFDGGKLEIDLARHEVRADGELRDLTATEFDLLMVLVQYPGRVYSRGEIASRLRGQTFARDERVIDVHIRNLRRKIESDPTLPRRVETVRGVGYRFGAEPS